jgi:hypothetical protein
MDDKENVGTRIEKLNVSKVILEFLSIDLFINEQNITFERIIVIKT